jgi:hypothetical protein
MHRIDSYGTIEVMPTLSEVGATVGYFTAGDPTTGVPATRVHQDWLNSMQEEIAAVIEAMGLTLTKASTNQFLAALKVLTGIPDKPSTATTTDATVTDLATVAVAEGDVVMVEASVVGRKSDGSALYSGKIIGTFYRNTGGNVTQVGAASLEPEVNESGWGGIDLVADTVAQTVDLRVTGAAATIKWVASLKVTKVSA